MIDVRKQLENVKLPVVAAPMFIVTGKDLVLASLKAGIVGTIPALNERTSEAFENLLIALKAEIADYEKKHDVKLPPYGVNLIVHGSNPRVEADLKICVKHQVPIIITSLGAVSDLVDAVHSYGGLVFHDVINKRHSEKAIEAGVDGLILVCAGAGGHAGTLHPMPFVKEVRKIFDGIILLSGCLTDGQDVASALQLGADYAYMGTRFINTKESNANPDYRQMIIDSETKDIVYTAAVSGVSANFMRLSLESMGITKDMWDQKVKVDFGKELDTEAKAWKTIWSAGQGVTSIHDVPSVADLVEELYEEFTSAIKNQQKYLDKYSA